MEYFKIEQVNTKSLVSSYKIIQHNKIIYSCDIDYNNPNTKVELIDDNHNKVFCSKVNILNLINSPALVSHNSKNHLLSIYQNNKKIGNISKYHDKSANKGLWQIKYYNRIINAKFILSKESLIKCALYENDLQIGLIEKNIDINSNLENYDLYSIDNTLSDLFIFFTIVTDGYKLDKLGESTISYNPLTLTYNFGQYNNDLYDEKWKSQFDYLITEDECIPNEIITNKEVATVTPNISEKDNDDYNINITSLEVTEVSLNKQLSVFLKIYFLIIILLITIIFFLLLIKFLC